MQAHVVEASRVVVVVIAVAATLVSACATLLDFKDPIDERVAVDAGGDAPVPTGPSGCACVPAPPDAWEGPLAFYEGTGGPPPPEPPSCSGDYPSLAFDGAADPSSQKATCSCSCGAPAGQACDPPRTTFFMDGDCTVPCPGGARPVAEGPACTALAVGACSKHVTVSAPTVSGGRCQPNAVSKVPAWGWSRSARLCSGRERATTDGCESGRVCTPVTTLPFAPANYCIARPGEWTCPATYPAARVYFHGVTDTRACSPCTCDAPRGATCEGTTVVGYDHADCTGGEKRWTAPRGCSGGGAEFGRSSPGTPRGGSCAARGGEAIGELVPTTPTTVCCVR